MTIWQGETKNQYGSFWLTACSELAVKHLFSGRSCGNNQLSVSSPTPSSSCWPKSSWAEAMAAKEAAAKKAAKARAVEEPRRELLRKLLKMLQKLHLFLLIRNQSKLKNLKNSRLDQQSRKSKSLTMRKWTNLRKVLVENISIYFAMLLWKILRSKSDENVKMFAF